MARAAGRAWADEFGRLSIQEQQTIIWRAVTGSIRYWARRMGQPVPIILESIVKPLDGGGYELASTAPLRPEWGGDGRTAADAEREAKRPPWHLNDRANWDLWCAAERIKAQIIEQGGTIIYEDLDPDPSIVPKPHRAAHVLNVNVAAAGPATKDETNNKFLRSFL